LDATVNQDFADIKVSVSVNPNPMWTAQKLSRFFARLPIAPTGNQFAVQSPNAHPVLKFGDVNDIIVRVKEKGVWSEQVAPLS
jgi:hypothetical protein